MEEKQEYEANEMKKWTLMFFFASDNNLSPSMLYQLKSIKGAGFQADTNVVVHFDPQERGVPSMIFEINRAEKKGQKASRIGDSKDLIIRNLAGDQVRPEIGEAGTDNDKRNASEALDHFLNVCANKYPAEQYMLFLVGHGLVVGHDEFLPDDNPSSGISLVQLGKTLGNFQTRIGNDRVLELVGMHSCSMSAVEVAYQLKGKAKYMLASEGLSFVGSWPYRQLLQKIFYAIDDAGEAKVDVSDLVTNLHELCVQNSADFIFAGYSSDLCLCSLEPQRVDALTAPVKELAYAMQAGLRDNRSKDLIQLAHLKAQSYFQEAYTDLFDFCLCLSESCRDSDTIQRAMKRACKLVMDALTPGNGPILQADFFGPDCQYSNGLSVYFPWLKPVEDANDHVIKNYETYAFETELEGSSWLDFLKMYFQATLRKARKIQFDAYPDYDREAALQLVSSSFKAIGFQVAPSESSSALTGKVNPSDAGGDWTPSAIKNYARDFAISERVLKVFALERGQQKTGMDYQSSALERKIA